MDCQGLPVLIYSMYTLNSMSCFGLQAAAERFYSPSRLQGYC